MFGEQMPITLDQNRLEKADQQLRETCTARVWEFAPVPPSRSEVIQWFDDMEASRKSTQKESIQHRPAEMKADMCSQIEGPTQKNTQGFKYSQKGKSTSVEHQARHMSTMSLEVHVNTRGTLFPNPEEDEIT
ncbi:DNA polymerase zeta, partial [Elasticomyces elasticus]